MIKGSSTRLNMGALIARKLLRIVKDATLSRGYLMVLNYITHPFIIHQMTLKSVSFGLARNVKKGSSLIFTIRSVNSLKTKPLWLVRFKLIQRRSDAKLMRGLKNA